MQSGCVKVRVGMIRAAMAVIACAGFLYASLMAADDTPSSVLRSRVYRIKHIAPERAKQILTDLKLGNEISLLQQNAMIVTGYSSADLIKATAVIGLVDSKTAYEIRTIGIPAEMLAEIQGKTLTVAVESLQVGTLRDAPMSKTEPGAIIDIHNGQLLVIAPKASMDKIAQEIVRLEEPYINKPSEGTAEKTATVEPILPATASATKVEPIRLVPEGAAMFPNLMALAEQWMASEGMDRPAIEPIGPVAPKETTTPTTGAMGLEELIAPTPPAATVPAGETEDELVKVLEQMSGRNTATAAAEAPAGEQQVDDAIARAIDAEKKAKLIEQWAAEAEAKAKEAEEALIAAKAVPPAAPAPAEKPTEAPATTAPKPADSTERVPPTEPQNAEKPAAPTPAPASAAPQPATPTTPPPTAPAPAAAQPTPAPAPVPQPETKPQPSAADELLKIAGGAPAEPAPAAPTPPPAAPEPAAPAPTAPAPVAPAAAEKPTEVPAASPAPARSAPQPAAPAPAPVEPAPAAPQPAAPVADKPADKPAEKPAEATVPAAPKPADSIPIDREVPPVGAVKPTDKPAEKPAVVKTDKPTGQPTVKPKPADQAPATKPSEAEAELLKAAENAADAELAAGLRELAAMTRQAEEAEAAAAAGQPTVEPVAVETPQPEQPKPDEKPQTKPPVETTPVKPTEAAGPRVKAQPKPKTEDSKIEAAVPEGTALTPKGIPDDGELELTMTLPEKVDILALIELVGKQLKLNYMFDPTKVRGDVLLKVHDGRIRVKDTYALLETVLKYKGFGMTRRGNLVTIVPLTDAMGQDPVILKEGQTAEPEAGQVVVTGVFSLKHISTQSAENMLKSMQLGTIFNSVSETQTLIVTDYAYRMERIRQLLDLVDVEGKKKRVEERFIRFYKASEMAPKVETMAGHLGTVSVSISAGPSAPTAVGPQPVPGTAPSAAAAAAAAAAAERARMAAAAASRGGSQPATEDTVRLETDDRTNRLFIIGTDEKIEIVNEIIDSLDIPQKSIRTIEEYKIQYIDTEEVVNTLFELGVIKNRPTSPTPTSSATMPRPRTPMPGAAPAAGGGGAASDNEPMISIRQSTNSLLINATDEQHADIALVIAQIDTEQSNKRTVQEYEIQFVDTAEIVQTLEELAIIAPRQQQGSRYGQQSSPYSRTGQQQSSMMNPTMPGGAAGAQPQPVPTTTAALTGEPTTAEDIVAEQPQIAVLESTNSLLVNATPRQHAAIALVIAHVDREPETTSTPYVVYPLENQDPEELAAVLDELVNATIQAEAQKSAPRTGTTGTSPLGTAGTTGPESRIQTSARPTGMGGQRSENEVTIVADKASYSLIVYGNKKNQQWIAQLIKVLDDYRPQVLLDATLVEISKDNEFTMDLNMVGKYPRMRPGGTMTGPTGGGFTGTPYVPPLVTPFPENSIMEGSVVNGSGTAFYADEHIQALLTLMDKKNYGRVLARPSLLVKDNQEGEIKAEKTIYVGEEKSIVTTPAQGDAITSSDIQFKDYKSGITLKITPHIATKEVLQLKIELDRTDFDPSDPGTATIGTKTVPKPLNTVSSNVVTMAVLPDGATIILGGIEAMTQTKGITKVPLLGDIPLIGILFRGVSESDVQSRLYVFVKANIVRPGDELTGDSDVERISRKKRDAFERDENMFQGLDSIPGIKPGKIQPEKILEDDEYIQSLRDRLDQKRKTKDKEPVKVEIKLD